MNVLKEDNKALVKSNQVIKTDFKPKPQKTNSVIANLLWQYALIFMNKNNSTMH